MEHRLLTWFLLRSLVQAIATVSACHIKGVVPDLPVTRGFAHWPIGFSKKSLRVFGAARWESCRGL